MSTPGHHTRQQRPACRYPCRACGRHFASVGAFDAHRVGKHSEPRHSLEGRRCTSVEGDERFTPIDGAKCTIGCREIVCPVLIWALAADRGRVREAFA